MDTYNFQSIEKNKISTGDLCFVRGKTYLAEQIRKAQRQRGIKNWQLNHVGWFIWINGILCVAAEDYPGIFDINCFDDEYVKTNTEVYVGKIKNNRVSQKMITKLTQYSITESSEDRLFDYGFGDILAFKFNSWMWKWFKWDVWIGRKKNKKDKYTCSQRVAKYLQKFHHLMEDKDYLKVYPGEIADQPFIKLYRIEKST